MPKEVRKRIEGVAQRVRIRAVVKAITKSGKRRVTSTTKEKRREISQRLKQRTNLEKERRAT
jgi:hypothetical protein